MYGWKDLSVRKVCVYGKHITDKWTENYKASIKIKIYKSGIFKGKH